MYDVRWKTLCSLLLAISTPNIGIGAPPSIDGRASAPAHSFAAVDPALKGSPSARTFLRSMATAKNADGPGPYNVLQEASANYVVVHLEFATTDACQALKHPELSVITRFDRFADVFLPYRRGEDFSRHLQDLAGLVWYEIATVTPAPPAPPLLGEEGKSRAIPDKIVRGGMKQLTGKGVVIAVLDTGIDFHHPDFATYDNEGEPTSRLLYLWDTSSDAYAAGKRGSPAPVSYPNGRAVGTIYSRQELTDDLRGQRPGIQTWDPIGHGTACAGIAAGNGNASKGQHAGVAPQADIIGVRLGARQGFENSYLMGAICEWLEKVVGDRPLVISCSFGGHYGGHDGSSVLERQISARFPPDRKGRAICIAAGNEGADGIHAEIELGGLTRPEVSSWKSASRGVLNVIVKTDQIRDLNAQPLPGTQVNFKSHYVCPYTKHAKFEIEIQGGPGNLAFFSASGKSYEADAYINAQMGQFGPTCAAYRNLIGTPSGTVNAITVGSYDWNDQFHQFGRAYTQPDFMLGKPLQIGGLSTYSSPGPLRQGRIVKPEVVAPGQFYTAPAPRNVELTRDSTGYYWLFNGTSAATPYMAGIVALLLQQKPDLTVAQIKQRLAEHASQDRNTGETPNPSWGYGKLDYTAAEKLLSDG